VTEVLLTAAAPIMITGRGNSIAMNQNGCLITFHSDIPAIIDRIVCLFIGNCANNITGINQYRVLFDNKPQLVRTHDYGFGSPGAVGGTAGAGTGCVGNGGGIGCGAGVSPGCGATSPAGGIPSVGNVGALQKPAGSM
jgi:hypothetical protein